MNHKKIRVLHFMGSGRIGGQERAEYQLFRALKGDDRMMLAVAIGRDEGPYAE